MGYSQQASYELFAISSIALQYLQVMTHNLIFPTVTIHLKAAQYYKGPYSVLKVGQNLPTDFQVPLSQIPKESNHEKKNILQALPAVLSILIQQCKHPRAFYQQYLSYSVPIWEMEELYWFVHAVLNNFLNIVQGTCSSACKKHPSPILDSPSRCTASITVLGRIPFCHVFCDSMLCSTK